MLAEVTRLVLHDYRIYRINKINPVNSANPVILSNYCALVATSFGIVDDM